MTTISKTGKLVKGIGGFYYVDCDNEIFECKARGSFRKQNIIPLVGDNVEISINENCENTIDKILERKNELVRPPLANLDRLFIIASLVDPKINTSVIDNLIAVAEYKGIEPIIVITKTDLDSSFEKYKSIYEKSGFMVFGCNNNDRSSCEQIKPLINGCSCAFTGNTGVGKSSLINNIFPELKLKTGETSKKLGRGKHTTRHCELFKTENGGYIADTPGFSSLDFMKCDRILKEDLPHCFREFEEYLGDCKFSSCSHTTDKGCAVIQAVKDGKIDASRHKSYVDMYNEVKNIKQWEIK